VSRTHAELLAEIALRKAHGLARITLTRQERHEQHGDPAWGRDDAASDQYLADRLLAGGVMSLEDKRRARRAIKARKP